METTSKEISKVRLPKRETFVFLSLAEAVYVTVDSKPGEVFVAV